MMNDVKGPSLASAYSVAGRAQDPVTPPGLTSLHLVFRIFNSRVRPEEQLNGLLPSPFRARKGLQARTVRANEFCM